MTNFKINISKEEKENLNFLLQSIKWPKDIEYNNNDVGITLKQVKKIINYWINDYDWDFLEKNLNEFNNFSAKINHQNIHYILEKGKTERTIPLLLLHGWPDSILRYTKVIKNLTKGFVINGSLISFDVIVPSIPGFAFSNYNEGLNNKELALLFNKLMKEYLRYDNYIISGGDVGSGIARFMAERNPDSVRGIHLTDVGIIQDLIQSNSRKNKDEEEYVEKAKNFFAHETGYMSIQSTKPQTLSFGLSDSIIGLTAWLAEKYLSWSGENLLSYDDIINEIYLYWHTNCIATSINIYSENSKKLPELEKSTVPVGLSIFKEDILLPPYSYVKDKYNLIYYNEIEIGGHFAATEVPHLYIDEIISFSSNLLQ